MSAKCATCGKTAYPMESLQASGATFHKLCFKCTVCSQSLNLKNYKMFESKVYCATHTPKVAASAQTTDSFQMKTALNAPKKQAEGLGKAQKGTGEKPTVGLDTVVAQTALKAPKKGTAAGVHKADPRVAPQKSHDFSVNQVGDQSTENNPDDSRITYESHSADQTTENTPDHSHVTYESHSADQSTEYNPDQSYDQQEYQQDDQQYDDQQQYDQQEYQDE
eukprot:TRINITY_DN136641_c0_g1_i1.p1 TRINITY_DN136641_c0_g1~~TRINITY_DN136641_c0_g1_i1.p1  ORF type:complete len:221 (-),score=115.87 TRINITY_DN136641_c0_g1_i1:56-718(-)